MVRQITRIIGPPGSGKGTQSYILHEYCKDSGNSDDTLILFDQGGSFRKHSEKINDDDASVLTHMITETTSAGKLLPSAVCIYHWMRIFGKVPNDKNFHIIMDGTWRTFDEIPVALNFLQALEAELLVIRLDVDEEECVQRLMGRKRSDDNEEAIRNRISAYFEQTYPVAIEFEKVAKDYPRTRFVTVDGKGTIDEVSGQIRKLFYTE